MKTKVWAMAVVLFCTILTSTAQILWKTGSTNFPEINALILIFLGFVANGIGAVLLILALKGGEVSVLYPIVATSYIWVTLMSISFFSEVLTFYKISGILLIIIGIWFISLGGKRDAIQYIEVL